MTPETRIAIVTGATGALGSAVVRHLSGEGIACAVPLSSGHSRGDLKKRGIDGVVAFSAVADLTSDQAAGSFVQAVLGEYGRIDILVNTAGGYEGGQPVREMGDDDVNRMFTLNFSTAFHMCRHVLPPMQKQNHGRIVNITAMPALSPGKGSGAYAISKRAVVTLTETIAAEHKGTGITANAIAPSILDTEANRAGMPDADFSRWVHPDELAFLIGTLCSDRLGSVSGNVLKAFGGV